MLTKRAFRILGKFGAVLLSLSLVVYLVIQAQCSGQKKVSGDKPETESAAPSTTTPSSATSATSTSTSTQESPPDDVYMFTSKSGFVDMNDVIPDTDDGEEADNSGAGSTVSPSQTSENAGGTAP